MVKSKKRLARIKGSSSERKRLLFYCLMLAFPVLQFCVFWIGVNGNSLLLMFQKYDPTTNKYLFDPSLSAIRSAFYDVTHNELLLTAAKNSAIIYLVGTVVGISLTLFFSYYIYKKGCMHKFYKVMLFLPAIVSSIVMVLVYKYFVESVVPEVVGMVTGEQVKGLISDEKKRFGTLLFYMIWAGFGSQLLMYEGAMEDIPISVVEAAKLDGATPMQEFFHITLPMIWPTLVTFLTVSVAGFFTNQMNLYSFYGDYAPNAMTNFGYFMFRETYAVGASRYPYVASLGLFMTLIAAPLTFGVKFLLEKFGPKTE